EGVAAEAASIAGHLKLSNLCWIYDDNSITIEGETHLAFTENVAQRFEGLGWRIEHVADANDTAALRKALQAFKTEHEKPTLIVVKSVIGYGAPKKAGSHESHGAPLGPDEIKGAKEAYGWPADAQFLVPPEVPEHFAKTLGARGKQAHEAWQKSVADYTKSHAALAGELKDFLDGRLPSGWDKAIPTFPADAKGLASRVSSGKVIQGLSAGVPWFLGGSADLAPSTMTFVPGAGEYEPASYGGRNFHFGIREHGMAAACNGLALSGLRPYCATFFVFLDYLKPSLRLSAIGNLGVIYVLTHDSIGLGEDGPTHQPIEHLTSLRCIPNLLVLRPADANEVAEAWRIALMHRDGPSAIILTRQKLACIDRTTHAPAIDATKGAYVLKDAPAGTTPAAVILASGSEVEIALQAQTELAAGGIATRVVSMCSMELFAVQDAAYQASVLPAGVRRVAIEAAHPMSWHRWVGDTGTIIGISTFGASAPAPTLYREYGITAEAVVRAVRG
ncbi:MAG: transketolase family protein, partial [Gemmatimonadota bacterium]